MIGQARWTLIIGGLVGLMTVADVHAAEKVTIPNSELHTITSHETGDVYQIQIRLPNGEAPEAGFPVVYLLDSNAWFGMASDLLSTRAMNTDSTGIPPAILVGIAYPTDAPYDLKRRTYDLTPPSEIVTMPPRPNGKPWPPTGGADAFLRLIETQVKPLVDQRAPVDKSQETLIGHSFGGLFALHVMLTQPEAFDTYLAGSPSIWFNQKQVLHEAKAHLAASGSVKGRVYICVGGEEEDITPAEEAHPQAEIRRQWKKDNRMIGNAQDFVALMSDQPELDIAFKVFEGEDHGTIIPQLMIHGLHFAFNQKAP